MVIIPPSESIPICSNQLTKKEYAQVSDRDFPIQCPCNQTNGKIPLWRINSSQPLTYDSINLPPRYRITGLRVLIEPVESIDNGTTFQCLFNLPNHFDSIGPITMLIVNSIGKEGKEYC